MIKANELRIGNLVLYNPYGNRDGKLVTIAGLMGMKAYFSKYNNEGGMFHHLQPMPLTEEWLKRMGFEDTNGGYRATGAEVVYSIKTAGRPIRLWWDYPDKWVFETWNDLNLQYVHQLQNLFFALTGEELTVKL